MANSARESGEFAFNSKWASLISILFTNRDFMRLTQKRNLRKRLFAAAFAVVAINAISVTFLGCSSEKVSDSPEKRSGDNSEGAEAKVAASAEHPDWYLTETCRECHEAEYNDWLGSHHHLAHRRLDLEKDFEAFSQGEVEDQAGRIYRLSGTDPLFSIEEVGSDLPSEVDSVIGETPIRQYLVSFPDGHYQIQGLTWDPHKKQWFNVFGDEDRNQGDWGHWSQQGMNWNSNCAWCHMTDFKKNYDLRAGSYDSEWKIEGISCVQCHSGMEEHVAAARAGNYEPTETVLNIELAMDNCASCHARREELTANGFKAGEKFDDHFRLVLPDLPNAYFVDGKANEENYVFGSLKMSRMGHKGVSCLDCHNAHSHKTILPIEDNSLCMRCHATGLNEATIVDPVTHSNHPLGSAGNQCVSCHMPTRLYMQRDARRDHGFTIPDPHMTTEYGVPNACQACHGDKPVEWARDAVESWFPNSERRQELRERARILDSYYNGDSESWAEVHGLLQSEENVYWRSAYLRILGAMAPGTPESLDAALKGMKSKSPVERESALRILSNRGDRLSDIQRALYDSSRLVRNQAADTLSTMYNPSQSAFQEWLEYAEANADRPAGALRRAELAVQQGDVALAKQLAEKATSFDRNNAHLLYDIAIMFARLGDLDGALRKISNAKLIDSSLGILWFGEGLLYAEKGDTQRSIEAMEVAVEKDAGQDRWWYNLGVAYLQTGQSAKAKEVLRKALSLNPEQPQYQQALESVQ